VQFTEIPSVFYIPNRVETSNETELTILLEEKDKHETKQIYVSETAVCSIPSSNSQIFPVQSIPRSSSSRKEAFRRLFKSSFPNDDYELDPITGLRNMDERKYATDKIDTAATILTVYSHETGNNVVYHMQLINKYILTLLLCVCR
jgi:hypothetical protein